MKTIELNEQQIWLIEEILRNVRYNPDIVSSQTSNVIIGQIIKKLQEVQE